jgi:hypothetical protein
MLMPIFILGLVLYFLIAWVLIRVTKPRNPEKVWKWLLVITLLACTADQITGYLYARTWILLTRGDPSKSIIDDSVVLEFKTRSARRSMDDPEGWIEPFYQMVTHGYAKLELIRHQQVGGVASTPDFFELSLVQSDLNSGCVPFINLSSRTKEILLSKTSTIVDGRTVRCISVKPINRIHARYLIKKIEDDIVFKDVFGISWSYRHLVIDLEKHLVISEARVVDFEGGWVKRTFWTGLDSGVTNSIRYRSYPFQGSYYKTLEQWSNNLYRPANHHQINN